MTKQFILASLVLVLASCERMAKVFDSSSSKVESQIEQAAAITVQLPDSAIHITDALLKHADTVKVSDQQLLKIYQIRVKSFAALGKTDSTLASGQSVRETAVLLSDSLAIAETVLDLYSNVDFKYINRAQRFLPGSISTFNTLNKKYETGIANAVNGVFLSNKGEYLEAQKYFMQSYKIFTELDSVKAVARICNSLGNNYGRINSLKESTDYYRRALQSAKLMKDQPLQASILINLGVNYKYINLDSAVGYYQQALNLLPVNYKGNLKLKAKYNLANIYMSNNQFRKAEEEYKNILASSIAANYQEGVAMAYGGLGTLYSNAKNYTLSVRNYQTAIKLLDSVGLKNVMMMLLPELINVYKLIGDSKNIILYSDQYYTLKDSLVSVEKTTAIHELEKRYQTEKKELENKSLRSQLSTKKLTNGLLVGLLILMTLFVLILRQRNYYHQQRNISYEVLIEKYREEKLEREKQALTPSVGQTVEQNEYPAENSLFEKIDNYYKTHKPYQNVGLKIEDIAAFLNVPTKDIFQSIKLNGFRNFNSFTNSYRVTSVRIMFEDPAYDHYKLESIWTAAGFGSKPTFYTAFVEETGIKPAYYRVMINKSTNPDAYNQS